MEKCFMLCRGFFLLAGKCSFPPKGANQDILGKDSGLGRATNILEEFRAGEEE
jgi:hypothetical protein